MQSGPGEIPPDREEIMEMLAAKMKNKRLPVFSQIMMPIKSFSNIQPNDGMRISFGLPMSQRFQCMTTFSFSNKEEAEFELNGTYVGSGSQMDEDVGFIMANSSSAGRLAIQSQTKLPWDIKGGLQIEMNSPDPNQANFGLTLQKDFNGSHFQYQYQGPHMLSYMQSITKNIIAGFSLNYMVS